MIEQNVIEGSFFMNLKRYGALLMAVTLPLAMASPLVHAEGTAYSIQIMTVITVHSETHLFLLLQMMFLLPHPIPQSMGTTTAL